MSKIFRHYSSNADTYIMSFSLAFIILHSRLGDPGVDGRIILRWIFRKWDVVLWTGSSWLRVGTGGGHL